MDPPSITTYIVLHHNSGQKTCIQVLYMGPEATLKQSVSCPADGQKCGQSSVCKISEYFIFFKFGGGGDYEKKSQLAVIYSPGRYTGNNHFLRLAWRNLLLPLSVWKRYLILIR